jgi:DNA-binding LytR/AlgR family response regulator
MTITCIIAEDESILRQQLSVKLKKLWPELEQLAAVGDGEAALEAITTHSPTIAFLDIQMPEMTGVEVAQSLAANRDLQTHVVFVTAFDQYAVQAFEAGAIDYVLKPYTEERLKATVARLRARLDSGGNDDDESDTPIKSAAPAAPPQDLAAMLASLAASLNPGAEKLRWIKANIGQNLRLIPIEDVLFFQSDEKYTLVATKDFDALIKTPIKELLSGLDTDKYWQIHRSIIVNAAAIDAVVRDFRGQAHVKVKGRKEQLTVSRPFSHLFKQM